MALNGLSDIFGPGTPFWELGDEMKIRLAHMVELGYDRGQLTVQLRELIEDDSIFEHPALEEMYELTGAGFLSDEQAAQGAAEAMTLLPNGPDTSFTEQTDAGDQFAGRMEDFIRKMMKGEPPTPYNIAFWETFTRRVTTSLNVIGSELKRQQLRLTN